jgi:peptide/nickel transport system ATP-binding protein/oligopeptide transport system ATP-binding protein
LRLKSTNNILLKVEDLRVYFQRPDERTARAVDGVTFDIGREETVCLVGESGCGKTVTALSILGLIPQPPGKIASGSARFGEWDLLTLDEKQLQAIRGKHISMVFQEPLTSLNPVFKIGEQIAEAIRIHEAIDDRALQQKCIRLLKDVGIPNPETRINAYPHELSGGQRQRIMIAMALACDPQLVIADEPTTALDVTVQAQILKLFKSLQQQRAMSVLYITHDLGVVANVADRVYVMYAGIVVEQGHTSHIFRNAAHPYTRGLLEALPTRGKRGRRLYSIPGAVPNPAFKPQGCPFHPRCPHAIDSCREQYPEMCDYENGHRSRCPVLYGR